MTTGPASRRSKGRAIEQLAAQHIADAGYQIVTSNYYTRHGEIDLIALSPAAVLVFIEVRYRRHASYGSGAESVTPVKQQKLRLAASHYLQHHGECDCRFDVISGSGDPVQLEWIQNAF